MSGKLHLICMKTGFHSKIRCNYAPNFEKVDGAYCFWSVCVWVGACVTLFVPSVTFNPLKLES